MTVEQIMKVVNETRKGTFTRIEYVSEPSLTAAAKRMGVSVIKYTEKVVRLGVHYPNIADVQRAEAERTTPKQERAPWCHWEITDILAKHNTKEAYYLAIATVNKGHNTKNRWFINGEEVTLQEIMESGYIIPSYFKDGELPVVQRINIEHILGLGKKR